VKMCPLLDRIDLHVEVSKIEFRDLNSNKKEESSKEIKSRVEKAHEIQKYRFKNRNIYFNSNMGTSDLKDFCKVGKVAKKLLEEAFIKLSLSARAYHRILKVARTIADLEGKDIIQEEHIAEAIQYRTLDRKYWSNTY